MKYEILLQTGPSSVSYGISRCKEVHLTYYEPSKPITRKIKILPLMIEKSVKGKKISQLVRFKIVSHQRTWHWWTPDKENYKQLVVVPDMNQNSDYKCYNCLNYEHKRCLRAKYQKMNSHHKEPCNCRKCWPNVWIVLWALSNTWWKLPNFRNCTYANWKKGT